MATQNAINSMFPVNVAAGGTGLATLTAHAVLVGEGTSAVALVGPGTAGQVFLSGGGSADPAYVTPTAGTGLSVTTNATTLSFALSTPVSTANGGSGVSSPTAHGILVAEGASAFTPIVLTNGQLLIGSTGADPAAASLTAGTGISITPGAGSITIANTATMYTWVDQTTTSVTLAPSTSYVADNAGLVTFTLPATAAFGDTYRIVGKGAGGWTLVENALQSVQFGSITTTIATGSLSSSNSGDCIEIVCITANTTFAVISSIGNITYV